MGGVATLIGVGGGSYTIAYFIYAARRNFQDAIAAANVIGFVIGALCVLAYLATQVVSRFHCGASECEGSGIPASGMVAMIVSGIAASSVGVHLSRRLPTLVLRRVLVGALAVSALHLYFSPAVPR